MNAIIPAPEIPPRSNKGGSQHQLDPITAEIRAPKLAKRSARLDKFSAAFD